MSEPRVDAFGNKAAEIADHEAGADFHGIDKSFAPVDVPDIQVTLKKVGNDLLVQPKRNGSASANQPGELQEGAREVLAATIFDDPGMMKADSQIEKRSERGSLVWYGFRPNTAAAMWGDRVLIKRDTLESAYSCRFCKGKGHTETQCPTCKGTSSETFHGETGDFTNPCRNCLVLGYDKQAKSACGMVPCASCNGSGWAGGIVLPEVAQSAPVAGIIVSTGPCCVNLRLGDRVLHSRYAGHSVDTPEGETYTTMHEHEVLWLMKEI